MTDSRHYDDGDPEGGQWGTPAWVWRPLSEALGGFDLDAATNEGLPQIGDIRFTPSIDGTETPWNVRGVRGDVDVWVNPPYGREENPVWAETVAREADRQGVRSITALVPASTGTAWFRNYLATADLLTVIPERLTFEVVGGEKSTHNATFGNVIVTVWNDEGFPPAAYLQALHDLGIVLERVFPGEDHS